MGIFFGGLGNFPDFPAPTNGSARKENQVGLSKTVAGGLLTDQLELLGGGHKDMSGTFSSSCHVTFPAVGEVTLGKFCSAECVCVCPATVTVVTHCVVIRLTGTSGGWLGLLVLDHICSSVQISRSPAEGEGPPQTHVGPVGRSQREEGNPAPPPSP